MYSDKEWINRIRGALGKDAQQEALQLLHKQLHHVAYNRLSRVRTSRTGLKNLSDAEISDLAEDFAQDTTEKVTRDNAALLDQYEGRGTFLGWIFTIQNRLIASELRRPYWTRRNSMDEEEFTRQPATAPQPEESTLLREIFDEIQKCLAQLPERRRIAFERCIIEGIAAEDLTEELQTTTNAIHIMNHRTRERIRRHMKKKGFGKDVLDMF